MSAVLDYVREKDPRFGKVSDEDLTLYLGERKPDFLQDPEFKQEYQGVAIKKGTEIATHEVGALLHTLTSPAAGIAAEAGRDELAFQRMLGQQEQPPRDALERAARDWEKAGAATAPVSHTGEPKVVGGTTLTFGEGVQLPRVQPPDEAGVTEKVAAGLYNVGASIPNFALSLPGIATMIAPEALPVRFVAPLLKGIFAGLTAKTAGEQLGKASVTHDPQDFTEGLGSAVMAGSIGYHGALSALNERRAALGQEKVKPPVADLIGKLIKRIQPQAAAADAVQQVAPATAEALKQPVPEKPAPQAPAKEPEPTAPKEEQGLAKDRQRYDELVQQMKVKPDLSAWKEMEEIKNRYGGKPPPKPETITHAAYQDEEGFTYRGANHPQILDTLGVEGFDTRESRNTAQFGFATDRRPFISREEAGTVAQASGQNLETFEPGEKVHSDQMESPKQPGQTLGDVEQPVTATPPGAPAEELEPEPALQGMGGAMAGEFPEPRQAAIAGSRVEDASPRDRPMGTLSSVGHALRGAWQGMATFIKGAFGDTMPKTTAAHRETGEAGARYLSSRIAAIPRADAFTVRVLEGTGVDPIKFGAALAEDNLQSVRESFKQAAEEERAKGNNDKADELDAQAQSVATIIGVKGSPFADTDEFFDYLDDPMVKKAIAQHIQLWQEVIEPQYKQAREIDPEVELPSRGLNTGARVNLKAVFPEDEESAGRAVTGSSGLTGTFKRRTPLSFKAKGTGQTYETNYQLLIRNTFAKQLEIANKNVFDNALVGSGNAVIDSPGRTPTTPDGEATTAFPLRRGMGSQNIYVRKSLSSEYRAAAGATERSRIPVVTSLMNVLNKVALAGLTDGTVHISNQLTALFDRPVSGKLLHDTLLSATGRADVPVTVIKTILKAFGDNRQQLAQLAEIGALRGERIRGGIFGGPLGGLLHKTDQLTRLMLDDTFLGLVKSGLLENTETARREYVNQIGQYNRRAQGWLIRTLRDTGFGPFATAGRTFNALGVKMATLSPGAPATSALAAAALRANVLSKWMGTAVVVGTLNYLLTKNKGGGLLGRKGTKLGDVDLGVNDKAGKQLSLPLASIFGVGRGMRVTGLKGAIEAKRMGLTDADALDAASRDIFNSWTGPAAGPPVKFGMIAATGYPPATRVGRVSPVVPPGESQFEENVWEALREASPVYSTYDKIKKGASLQDILATQLPRLSPAGGKTEALAQNYPQIVKAAQASEFINFVVHETRRQAPDDRMRYAAEQIKRLPPEFQKRAWDELKHRKAFAQ